MGWQAEGGGLKSIINWDLQNARDASVHRKLTQKSGSLLLSHAFTMLMLYREDLFLCYFTIGPSKSEI